MVLNVRMEENNTNRNNTKCLWRKCLTFKHRSDVVRPDRRCKKAFAHGRSTETQYKTIKSVMKFIKVII